MSSTTPGVTVTAVSSTTPGVTFTTPTLSSVTYTKCGSAMIAGWIAAVVVIIFSGVIIVVLAVIVYRQRMIIMAVRENKAQSAEMNTIAEYASVPIVVRRIKAPDQVWV